MKVAILCGGKGTRMKEITDDIPKPLALIGGKPILWHIMKIYSHYGFNDFVLLLGYKGEKIKEFFMDYEWKNHDFILNTSERETTMLQKGESWKIAFIDTGVDTMTGARIKRAQKYIGNETFMLTYGDGVADIDIKALLNFHSKKERVATVTGIQKNSQYGTLEACNGLVKSFQEKTKSIGMINGGFFVFNKEIFDYLYEDERCVLEEEPLMNLSRDEELAVYEHNGFWTAMDTYKDILHVNELWDNHQSLWKVW
ncbi:MAG: glucose-1-phosphate cytidylyltransferase [Bacillota bacterium]